MIVIAERMNCFFNLSCCCVGFIIHYFLVFAVEVMVVFPAMISSFVSSGISSSYSSGVFSLQVFVLIFRNKQPHSLRIITISFYSRNKHISDSKDQSKTELHYTELN